MCVRIWPYAAAAPRGDEAARAAFDARLQEIIAETGAAMHVEDLIEELTSTALEAIARDEIDSQARKLLTEMAIIATKRNT